MLTLPSRLFLELPIYFSTVSISMLLSDSSPKGSLAGGPFLNASLSKPRQKSKDV